MSKGPSIVPTHSRIRAEILIVLAITFGISGVRAILRLVDSLLDPAPLNEQSVTLNAPQSDLAWLDIALQLCSAGVLFAYGALALFLLAGSGVILSRPESKDAAWGAGLAALIGIPGLVFYVSAVHLGLSKEIIPTAFSNPWVEAPTLLLWSGANAFGEEIVVVMYLMTRLRYLGWSLPAMIAASSILRGSYHLYQGVSAGFGNIIMGVVFCYFYHRTGRIWPLVIAHFLIDAVAFLGYSLLGDLSIFGL
ncbi:CPBP family intramembrane glutamic endopeptidase [Corynebacterium sp. L4756]|uniref:CPBP family intramembrane glutamic endopeptidase n=1 Tax=unclassified Corynebacterium TaxID=2624378 RepID=UPI00374D48E1